MFLQMITTHEAFLAHITYETFFTCEEKIIHKQGLELNASFNFNLFIQILFSFGVFQYNLKACKISQKVKLFFLFEKCRLSIFPNRNELVPL